MDIASRRESPVIILGVILLVLGLLLHIGLLETIGIILLVVGAVLWLLGSTGRPVFGRRHYW
jgi:membrane-bound ClpP family serine protease